MLSIHYTYELTSYLYVKYVYVCVRRDECFCEKVPNLEIVMFRKEKTIFRNFYLFVTSIYKKQYIVYEKYI